VAVIASSWIVGGRSSPPLGSAAPCNNELDTVEKLGDHGRETGGSTAPPERSPRHQVIMQIALLNGPNLNLLGTRRPEVYGSDSLDDIVQAVLHRARDWNLGVWSYQSNGEGELVSAVQEAAKSCVGIVINPAAYSHTSIAIRDALEASELPVIEVHISNVFARESFRHHSMISPVARGVIVGLGANGYLLAVDALAHILGIPK
jgi:3-dehydroquinate dehydratase-2